LKIPWDKVISQVSKQLKNLEEIVEQLYRCVKKYGFKTLDLKEKIIYYNIDIISINSLFCFFFSSYTIVMFFSYTV